MPGDGVSRRSGLRSGGFRISVVCLAFATLVVCLLTSEGLAYRYGLPTFLFAMMLLMQCMLLSGLAHRLYQQHGVTRRQFDVGAIMIITAMIALPMGYINLLDVLPRRSGGLSAEPPRDVLLVLSYFSVLPCLSFSEGVAGWLAASSQRKVNR